MLIMTCLFLAAGFLDYVYVRFNRSVATGDVWRAVAFSGVVSALGMFNCWYLIYEPATIPVILLGHMTGCWIAMRRL
jgi:hypothetical protein